MWTCPWKVVLQQQPSDRLQPAAGEERLETPLILSCRACTNLEIGRLAEWVMEDLSFCLLAHRPNPR